ncbi:NAD-dependent epimerase/dehydratase family protein [Lactobacillus sp. ESL0233]|uniref:NAD(P)H-binding protein n=1 Tax=Lactobacillus sp. ESL0233 TaxID=2069354 RepID=UPI000EFA7541|nr:NAD(P)H-binding protein [Lactobacillus sp. ESL0233]RMC41827.1 NAD-dependent epimerase/dehydratase family protein [Lactobacillus sp. ESL0233]
MMKVLIIGASGSIGQVTRQYFLQHSNDTLTLMARHTQNLQVSLDPTREQIITGDALNQTQLQAALKNQDVVFVAVSGAIEQIAQILVKQMPLFHLNRLIFITSMGIYNEIPAAIDPKGNLITNPILTPYRKAADIIESSSLNYTIIRPGWFDNGNDTAYQLTQKGEPFGGHDVSRLSIADLVLRLVHDPNLGRRKSLGINRIN